MTVLVEQPLVTASRDPRDLLNAVRPHVKECTYNVFDAPGNEGDLWDRETALLMRDNMLARPWAEEILGNAVMYLITAMERPDLHIGVGKIVDLGVHQIILDTPVYFAFCDAYNGKRGGGYKHHAPSAALGLAATAGCAGPDRPAAPAPSGGAAAGAQAARAHRPSAYRLQPFAGSGPPRATRALPRVRRAPILRVDGPARSMVLTFDDGPDPRYTPGILKTLRKHDVRAMFFVCGEMAVDNKDLLREMADDGHVIGNHTWTHPLLTRLDRSSTRDEIERTCDAVEDITGAHPAWFRAPYGAWNRNAFELGAELGMEPLAWTVDTLDWTEPGPEAIVRRVRAGAAPGVVVLSHDAGGDRSGSVDALREYLPELLDSGYRLTVPSGHQV
ncbi:hypothetical protein SALBM135S_05801 [Streptomyces alboniger]